MEHDTEQKQPSGGGGAGTTSGTGLDSNIAGLLSYILGWVTGLIFFLIEKEDKFVRFHAMQSILYSVALFVIMIAATVISGIFAFVPGLGALIGLLIMPIVWLGAFVLWIILMIKAYQGEKYRLPLIGDMAEKYAN